MALVLKESRRPEPWKHIRARVRYRALIPFLYFEWISSWVTYAMSQWVLLELLEYCGTLSILIGVIVYFAESKSRLEQKHYQAWQVINTAQGKGGSGGRIDALQDLNADKVSLVGVDLSDASLQGINLTSANLLRARFSSADVRNAIFRSADMEISNFDSANLREADLTNADLEEANLDDADLTSANLIEADMNRASLNRTDLRGVNLQHIANWQQIASMKLANIAGIKNAPDGFVKWATDHGAVQIEKDADWDVAIKASRMSDPVTSP